VLPEASSALSSKIRTASALRRSRVRIRVGAQPRHSSVRTRVPNALKLSSVRTRTKGKDSAQTQQQRGDERKGAARNQQQPQQDRGTGSAQTQQQREGKGTAQTQQAQPDKGAGSAQTDKGGTSDTGKTTAQTNQSGAQRVQLSDKQRTDVHSTVLKESNVNRATDVNISINVGTKLPRSVRLAPLPASIVSTVPQFRSFQYVAVNEQIAIVDPNTYEIVEVISGGPGRAASTDRGGQTQLTLTEEEKNIILSEVDASSDSTMGLGAMTEGADAPRNAQLKSFPQTVTERVPKVRNHKFFAADNRVAIVDPQGSKVQLVIGPRQ
jgi:hypothetical protein